MTIPGTVRTVGMLLEPELLRQVQDAATAHGASGATWVCHAMQQVTIEDFPQSWRAGESAVRLHDSHYYHQRFMLRLDDATAQKSDTLTQGFERPAAEVIRQLIAQAKLGDFPESWQLAVEESRVRRAPPRNS